MADKSLDRFAISKEFNQSYPLQPGGSLELQNVNGTVEVQGWDRDVIEVHAVKTAKQFLTYVSSGPFQYAIAVGLQLPDSYFAQFRNEMLEKRDRLCAGLTDAGFDVLRPQGTYFATVDIRSFGETDGLAFCRSLPRRCGVVAVPSVVFYDDVEAGGPLVRFACCKRMEVLDEACTRLKSLAK